MLVAKIKQFSRRPKQITCKVQKMYLSFRVTRDKRDKTARLLPIPADPDGQVNLVVIKSFGIHLRDTT